MKKVLSPKKRHQQQMLVQVWLPLGLVIAVLAAIAVLVILSAGDSSPVVGQAASVSLIFLIAPVIMMGLFYAFLVGLAIYLTAKLIIKTPSITRPAQALMEVISFKTEQIATSAAAPMIKIRSILAAARKFMNRK